MPWWWSTGPSTRFEVIILGRQGFAQASHPACGSATPLCAYPPRHLSLPLRLERDPLHRPPIQSTGGSVRGYQPDSRDALVSQSIRMSAEVMSTNPPSPPNKGGGSLSGEDIHDGLADEQGPIPTFGPARTDSRGRVIMGDDK